MCFFCSNGYTLKFRYSMLNSIIFSCLLLALGFIWGTGPVINKFAISKGVSPVGYTFWQFIGPAILLSTIAIIKKQLRISREHIQYYFICGLVGLAIPNTILHICAPYLPAGLLPIIINMVPIIIYPLALISGQEKFYPSRLFGIIIGMFGIMLLLSPNINLPSQNTIPWAMLAFVTPVCFAITALFINPYKPKNTSPLSFAAGMLIAATIFLTPLMLYIKAFYPITIPFNLADYAITMRILMHCLGYIIFFTIINKAGPVFYSLVSGVVIINGLLWGYIVFDETLSMLSLLAITAILLAIIIMNFSHREATR